MYDRSIPETILAFRRHREVSSDEEGCSKTLEKTLETSKSVSSLQIEPIFSSAF